MVFTIVYAVDSVVFRTAVKKIYLNFNFKLLI